MIYFLKIVRLYIGILFLIFSNLNLVEAAPEIEETNLKVGYVENTGFVEEDWSGHQIGYGYEYMESLSIYGNWNFEYVPYKSWNELVRALKAGEVDIIPCMPGDYRGIKNTSKTDHVVGRFPMALVVKDLNVKPEMKIGNLSENYQVPALPYIAENEGFSYTTVNYPDYYDMVAAFEQGEIDGYIEALVQPQRMNNLLAIFDRQSYRLLVNSKDKELLDQLNMAMDQMLLYQPGIRDRLNNKYLRSNGYPLILSREEREYLKVQKKLTAAILDNQKPDAYIEDGKIQGSIPDIMRKIAEDLGIEIEIIGVSSQNEADQVLKSGKVDFLADAITDYSWAKNNNINLTQPYIKIGYVSVHRKDYLENIENIDGQNINLPRVACVKDLMYTKSYIEPKFPPERRVYVNSIEEAFSAVSNSRADILFVPRQQANYYMESADIYNLEVGSEIYFSDALSIGVPETNTSPLWHILNKEINHIDDDFIHGVMSNNKISTMHMTPKWFIYHHPTEVIICIILISWLIGGIIIYRHQLKRHHVAAIQHMAYTDSRYNLPNLTWMESEMPQFISNARRTEPNKNIYIAVLTFESNATIVEQYGEELLIKHMQTISKQLNNKSWAAMTAIGIGSNSLICVCLAKSDTQIAEYIGEILEDYSYIETKDSRIWLHMKAGISEYKSTDLSVRQVVEKANAACDRSSNNDVCIFDDKLQEDLSLQQKIESRMEKALTDGEFKAWYQPKYDIKTRRIIGAEALVRWTSADLGFMPPGKFIPLFEKNGFVIPVDYTILEQAFQLQKQRLAEGKEVVPISVNQSRLHMTEEGYLDKIKAIIDKYKLSPTGLIELEVTETVFGDFDEKTNQKRAAEIISKLHEMGFTISVDDFGSGYSSFMMLNYLPMDVMKIDRSLLNASGDSQRMRNILGNVINLGRTLNMQVICEGIETREQEELLLELGCNYGQGFLNAKPMPLDDFIKFFEKRNAEVA